MTRANVAHISGLALNWLVARAENLDVSIVLEKNGKPYRGVVTYSVLQGHTELDYLNGWTLSGVIIEREWIGVLPPQHPATAPWVARKQQTALLEQGINGCWEQSGPTALIAAMRCYVMSKLGAELDFPVELL